MLPRIQCLAASCDQRLYCWGLWLERIGENICGRYLRDTQLRKSRAVAQTPLSGHLPDSLPSLFCDLLWTINGGRAEVWNVNCFSSLVCCKGSHDDRHPPLNENQSAHSEISGAIAFPDGDMHVWFPSIVVKAKSQCLSLLIGGLEIKLQEFKKEKDNILHKIYSHSHISVCLRTPSSSLKPTLHVASFRKLLHPLLPQSFVMLDDNLFFLSHNRP